MSLNLSKMSKEQIIALYESKLKAESSGLMVKVNQSGGVYIRHNSFKEFSDRTQKEYTAGINVPMATAVALFGNKDLCAQIFEAINNIGKQ